MSIVLITRQGCHLCDEALASLRSLGLEPELRDVDSDEQLHSQYDWRVPVVLVDGRVVAEGRIDHKALSRALETP
ncbi:MAG TPA: glutaredoxin family protein [Candidatus Eisenbacteria bacterium]|nr:glutaredoxin family protein [Candidatus Eisenbacteria bacterium]